MPTDPSTTSRLVFLTSLSPLALWLCGGLLVAAAWAAVQRLPKSPVRPMLIGCRISIAGLLLLLLGQPALERAEQRHVRSRLAVVVDRSASMGQRAPIEGQPAQASRGRQVADFLGASTAALQGLQKTMDVDFYDLESETSRVAVTDPNQLPSGRTTDLLQAVERPLPSPGRTQPPLAGILLISDGADHAELEAVGDAETLPPEIIRRLQALGVPLSTLAAGSRPAGSRDLRVGPLQSDDIAFVHNSVRFVAPIWSIGYPALQAAVTLRRDGLVLATQRVHLAPEAATEVEFTDKPKRLGDAIYSVEVALQPDEIDRTNNLQRTLLTVNRDKIRVLQVAGHPSWDERFLRQHLKENPNVDLVSFFILRTPNSDLSIPERDLSLIPFPVDQLFTTELASFDVVVFQDFDYRPFNMARYLPNLRRAIEGGLGFIMLGGGQSLDAAGYAGSPLEPILPVLLRPSAEQAVWLPGPIGTVPGPHSLDHPVLDLARDSTDRPTPWTQLPSLVGINALPGLAPGAISLLVDPQHRGSNGNPLPLLSAREVQGGRTMVLATDSLWRWRFAGQAQTLGARTYARLWSNLLRWLVHDPAHERLRLWPTRRRFEPDERVSLRLRVLDRAYQLVDGAQVTLSLHQADRLLQRRSLAVGRAGAADSDLQFGPLPEGAYRVEAKASLNGTDLGHAQGMFLVQSTNPELTDRLPRPQVLGGMARAGGGMALPLEPASWGQIPTLAAASLATAKRDYLGLWDNLWVLLTLAGLVALDGGLRRRIGIL
jgi:uncharacterized membrane protein